MSTIVSCILYIYSTNIGTEYFKHGIYSPFSSLQNAVCFIILTYLVSVLFTFYIQDALKLNKQFRRQKVNVPVHATKAYGGEEVYFHSFLMTLDASEYLPAPSYSRVGKRPQYHHSRGIAG